MTYPPALMKKATAVAYCDMSARAFERQVLAGILPQPVILDKKEFWYRKSIDRALGVLAGDLEPEWEDIGLYETSAR